MKKPLEAPVIFMIHAMQSRINFVTWKMSMIAREGSHYSGFQEGVCREPNDHQNYGKGKGVSFSCLGRSQAYIWDLGALPPHLGNFSLDLVIYFDNKGISQHGWSPTCK